MTNPQWLTWVQRLQAIAQSGLTYCEGVYDRERYQQVQVVAAEMAAEYTLDDPERIKGLFAHETGYATPKIDLRGFVFREDRVLLVLEKADGRWTVPGGFADVGDAPSAGTVREIFEESGYTARAVRLLAVYDRAHPRHAHPPLHYAIYGLFFLCEITGGAPALSIETGGVGFFPVENLPPLSEGRITAAQIRHMAELAASPDLPADFD